MLKSSAQTHTHAKVLWIICTHKASYWKWHSWIPASLSELQIRARESDKVTMTKHCEPERQNKSWAASQISASSLYRLSFPRNFKSPNLSIYIWFDDQILLGGMWGKWIVIFTPVHSTRFLYFLTLFSRRGCMFRDSPRKWRLRDVIEHGGAHGEVQSHLVNNGV